MENKELNKFNWGAFYLTWIWGIPNNTYVTFVSILALLLCWIPIIGWIAPLGVRIWFGIMGNRWAYQNKVWESDEEFQRVQKNWGIGALVWFLVNLAFAIIYFIIFVVFAAAFATSVNAQ